MHCFHYVAPEAGSERSTGNELENALITAVEDAHLVRVDVVGFCNLVGVDNTLIADLDGLSSFSFENWGENSLVLTLCPWVV